MPDPALPAAAPVVDTRKSLFDRLGAALPIALTAIATAFAGLSTGELQRAMLWRSAAAQDQSRATDQWTLAGFKRDRSLILQVAAAQLRATAGYARPHFPDAPDGTTPANHHLAWLGGKGPPTVTLPEIDDDRLRELLRAIRGHDTDEAILSVAVGVRQSAINHAIDSAESVITHTDQEWEPTLMAAANLIAECAQVPPDAPDRAARVTAANAAQAAGFELENRRYRVEAGLNQGVGYLYEARVKVSTARSDRHRAKSEIFFYAMLAGQIGATIASLALARKQKNTLWLLAGLAGIVSIAIGVYVYVGL